MILKELCLETIDIVESSNFQIYNYYYLKLQFLKYRNRLLMNEKKNGKLELEDYNKIFENTFLKKEKNNYHLEFLNKAENYFIIDNPTEAFLNFNFLKEIFLTRNLKNMKKELLLFFN